MPKKSTKNDLAIQSNQDVQLREFEENLLDFIGQNGLPTELILVSIDERVTVFSNLGNILKKIDSNQKQRSVYISKFVTAVASGLFDAALNYLWDETILELRRRVAQYDLSYFYDNAVSNEEKRKRLSDDNDLIKLDDSELIYGAREIGLISELGFKHLEYIKYQRNWASAAHPNQNQLTGLTLSHALETCIKEVISLPLSDVVVEIKRLLANVKTNAISSAEARAIAASFLNLNQEQINNLAAGFFGIYTRSDTTTQTRQNIRLLLPFLWDRVDDHSRHQFGVKYGKFVANNDQEEKDLARGFLETVSAVSYIPDDLRAIELETAVENLLAAHRGYSNFHNEPPFARELQRLVGGVGKIPLQVNRSYVLALVEVFLTNGNGTAWSAEYIYKELISQFDPTQALTAILAFENSTIASRLQFSLAQTKYRELLSIMREKVSAPAVKELLDDIDKFVGPLDRMKDDIRITRLVKNLQKILDQ